MPSTTGRVVASFDSQHWLLAAWLRPARLVEQGQAFPLLGEQLFQPFDTSLLIANRQTTQSVTRCTHES